VTPEISADEVREILIRAEMLRKRNQYTEAIDLLVDALEAQIDRETIYYRLGNVYVDAGRLDLAEYAYQRTLEMNPKHINARYNLSVVYKRQGKVEAAVRMRRDAYRLEITQGGRRKTLTSEEKRWVGQIGVRAILLVLGALAVFVIFAYLFSNML
jgi:tetratricopeptide (TPR) repeat protein